MTRLRHTLLAAAGYAMLTLAVLWPAVTRFGSEAMAHPADGSVFRWIWWQMPRAIGDGTNPFSTDRIFFPVGIDLSVTTSAPLISALTWPVRSLFGDAAQLNLVQLLAMFLSGLAAYLLALNVCRARGPAFLAGVMFALLPHRLVDVSLGHLNLVHLWTLPLGLLAFLTYLDKSDRTRTLLLGAALGTAFLVEPQLAILIVFATVPMGVVRRADVARAWRGLVGAGALAAVLASPLLVPLVGSMLSGEAGSGAPTEAALVYSASPLSWVVPPLDRLWIGHLASLEPLTPTLEGVAYPGLIVLALAVAGRTLTRREERTGWVAMAVMGVILSLGPYPFVRNTVVEIPFPFFLVAAVPGLDSFRVPGRFAVIGALALAVLASSALADLTRRHPRQASLLVALACGLTLVELLPRSLPASPRGVPEPYQAIADNPNLGAVLEIPVQWSTGQRAIGYGQGRQEDFLFLINATVHHRPTVSGAASRYSDERLDQLLENLLYRQLLALQGEPGYDDPVTFDRDDLVTAGIGFVAYDRDEPVPPALAYFEALDLSVLADDGTVIVWSVDG